VPSPISTPVTLSAPRTSVVYQAALPGV
jgi:hypothetical protein